MIAIVTSIYQRWKDKDYKNLQDLQQAFKQKT